MLKDLPAETRTSCRFGPPESLLERFKREAQATSSLQSPHTIQVYDFGVTAAGQFYYVMELLSGADLETIVRIRTGERNEQAIGS